MEVNQSTVSMVSLIFSSLIVGGVAWKFWREYNSAKVELKRGASFKEITDWSLTPAMAAGMKIVGALAMLILLHNFVSHYVVGKTTTGTVVAGTSVVLDTIGSSAKSAANAIGDAASSIGGSFSSEPINAETVLDMAENNSIIRIDTSGSSSAPISGGNAPVAAPVAAPVVAPVVAPVEVVAPEPESAAPAPMDLITDRSAVLIAGNSDWQQLTVLPGDSMSSIARRYGLSVADLCGMNASSVPNCNMVKSGQVIKLPTSSSGVAVRERVQVAAQPHASYVAPTRVPAVVQAMSSGRETYTIKPGDSVFTIAQATGRDVYSLCVANRSTTGDNCDNFAAGATLVLP